MDRLRDADTTLVVPNPFDIPPPGTINDKPGFFIDCDLEGGFLGTPFRAYWANMITECIRNAILRAGIAPEYTDWHQLGLAIEKIAERIATLLIEQALNDLEFVQDGGNVTGTIKNKKFTLNAPVAPPLPTALVQEGGNVSGTISIADGTFTLNAEDTGGGGGGGTGPAIPDKILAIGSGTSIRPAQNGDKAAAWDNGELGVSGVISCGNGYIRSSVYDGQPLSNASDGLFLATTSGDGSASAYFFKGATNSTPANPGGVRKFAVDMLGTGFLANTVLQAADYAEWFEGLPDMPPGIAVVIGACGVRPFDPGTDALDDIIGVVRPRKTRAALIGNAAENHWAKIYLVDDFGDPAMTHVTETHTDAETGLTKTITFEAAVLNPSYDPSLPYIPRSQRPEWNLIGLVGQVPVLNGQPLNPRWRVMRPVSETVTLVYIR